MTAPWVEQVLAAREVWQRAPSAHNTQPWTVTAEGDTLRLGWDEERHLAVGDPTRRDLLLSLGAAGEALRIVGADLDVALQLTWDVDLGRQSAAVIAHTDDSPDRSWTGADLQDRRTARCAFREPWVSEEQVRELSREAALAEGLSLQVVPPAWIQRWLTVADRWTLQGPAAAELRTWLRLRRSHPRWALDGLSAEAMGLSRLEATGLRAALTAPARTLLARTGAMRLLAAQATARPLGTVVALVSEHELDPNGVAAAGTELLRTWLAAQRHGWSAHPISALLDCPDSRAAWPLPQTPLAVYRVGVPVTAPPRSARVA